MTLDGTPGGCNYPRPSLASSRALIAVGRRQKVASRPSDGHNHEKNGPQNEQGKRKLDFGNSR
jgi:hypothetical protein